MILKVQYVDVEKYIRDSKVITMEETHRLAGLRAPLSVLTNQERPLSRPNRRHLV
jgi:hypothetical protein